MTEIIKDNGQWEKSPLGIKNGNLKSWKNKMYSLCSIPEKGTIVVTISKGEIDEIGYRCIQPDGYDTVW